MRLVWTELTAQRHSEGSGEHHGTQGDKAQERESGYRCIQGVSKLINK